MASTNQTVRSSGRDLSGVDSEADGKYAGLVAFASIIRASPIPLRIHLFESVSLKLSSRWPFLDLTLYVPSNISLCELLDRVELDRIAHG